MQRLQVGVTGIAGVVLMVGLAGIFTSVANDADEAAVPDAAPTTEPSAPPPQRDPLADAGVVPDIAAEPTPTEEEADISKPINPVDAPVTVPDTPPTDLQNDPGSD